MLSRNTIFSFLWYKKSTVCINCFSLHQTRWVRLQQELLKGSGDFKAEQNLTVSARRDGFELRIQVLGLTTANYLVFACGGRPFCSSAYGYSLSVFWISSVWLRSYWIKTCFGVGGKGCVLRMGYFVLFLQLDWQTWQQDWCIKNAVENMKQKQLYPIVDELVLTHQYSIFIFLLLRLDKCFQSKTSVWRFDQIVRSNLAQFRLFVVTLLLIKTSVTFQNKSSSLVSACFKGKYPGIENIMHATLNSWGTDVICK